MSWVDGADGSGFGTDHLPYGLISSDGGVRRPAVRIGGFVLDLAAVAGAGLLPPVVAHPSLKPLMSAGPSMWSEVRHTLQDLLTDGRHQAVVQAMLQDVDGVDVHLPFEVADYVDFYSSEQHATNLGRMFRPDSEPLLPNWKHLPVGYHGRAGTVVVSGTPVRRPSGQRRGSDGPTFGPSERLDIELELGFVVGVPSEIGSPVTVAHAAEHIFGFGLVNDWSARDIQAWEYVPLGPFLGKSFATSLAGWVTPLAALEPFRIPQPVQDPEPLPYLRSADPWGFDIDLEVLLTSRAMREVGIEPMRISATNFGQMYWTPAQQLAHLTVNGASTRTGDLCASGTISGSEPGTYGSFIELTHNGADPLTLPTGESRAFLQDGDEVILRGTARNADSFVELASVTGEVLG